MIKQAIFFKRQSDFLKTNSFKYEEDRFCTHCRTHFVDSVIFAAVGFFSSSGFCISFPCFPAFFHCGRTASVGLWAAIRTEDTLPKSSLTRVLFVPLDGIRPCGGRTKRMHYIISNQSQRKILNCHVFPPTFYQIWQATSRHVHYHFRRYGRQENNTNFYAALFAFLKSAAGIFNNISLLLFAFHIEFLEDFLSSFMRSWARFLPSCDSIFDGRN